nr:colicin immunity domain-containing protein [Rhodococcus fascians]
MDPSSKPEPSKIFRPVYEALGVGQLSADEFESRYLKLAKTTLGRLAPAGSVLINQLFTDVDAFVADHRLQDEDDLDENHYSIVRVSL